MDREGDEQSTQRRHQVGPPRASDGERRNADQAESTEPQSGDNDQRTVQGDPGQPCEPVFDLNELLKELEREQLGSSIIERAFYPAHLAVPPRERSAEWSAWEMLAWASPAGIAPFDEDLAAQGWYSAIYRQRSDQGLAEIDAQEKTQAVEVSAFQELNRLGVLTENDYFLPSEASNAVYSTKLDDHLAGRSAPKAFRSPERRAARGPRRRAGD